MNFVPGRYDDLNSFGNDIFRTEETIGASLKFESRTAEVLSYALELGYS